MQKKTLLKTSRNVTQDTPNAPRTKPAPTREAIAQRAYEIYTARGIGGRELEDWIQAERELWGATVRNN